MDLIKKFDAVEVQPDFRISPEDKQFCERHQAAYLAALQSFQELIYFWQDVLSQQKVLLGSEDSPPTAYNQYLAPDDAGVKITIRRIRMHIDLMHRRFIHLLTGYFLNAYRIELSEDDVVSELLQPKPKKADREALDEYLLWSTALQIRYQDVLSVVLRAFDGRSFSEQRLYELISACRNAAWDNRGHKPTFERKNTVISFCGYFCRSVYERSLPGSVFTDDMRAILPCIAHFETGRLGEYPTGFPRPPFSDTVSGGQLDLLGAQKLASLRLFKNGRVDIRFTSEGYAQEFIDRYLSRVYPGVVHE